MNGVRRSKSERVGAFAAAIVAIVAIGVTSRSDGTVVSQDSSAPLGPPLALQSQTYVVTAGSVARFDYVVNVNLPEITTTTTTSTTTTTTTTTLVPLFPPDPVTIDTADIDPADIDPVTGQPVTTNPFTGEPEIAPPATEAPTTTTTIPAPPEPVLTVRVRMHTAITQRKLVDAALLGTTGPTLDTVQFPLVGVDGVALFDELEDLRRLTLDIPIGGGGTAPATDASLDPPRPGVYPLTVQILRDSDIVATDRTFIEHVATDGMGRGPFFMSIVAGIRDVGPTPSEADVLTARPQLTELAAVANAVDGNISALIPPSVARSVLDTDPELAALVATALTNGELLVGPDYPLDPAAAAEADLQEHFSDLLAAGTLQIGETLPAVARASNVWISNDRITAGGMGLLNDNGISSLIMPWDVYLDIPNNAGLFTDTSLTVDARHDDVTAELLVIDPIARLLDPNRAATDTPAADAVQIMATTGAMRQQLDPDLRGLILATPHLAVPDATVIAYLGQFIAQHPSYQLIPVSEFSTAVNTWFVDGSPYTVDFHETPGVQITNRVERVNNERLQVIDIGSMMPAGAPEIDRWSQSLTHSLSTAFTATEALAIINRVDAEIQSIRDEVVPPEPFNFTVTGRESSVRIRIRNTGPHELRVVVHIDSERLTIRGGDFEVVLAPNFITDVVIPVETRTNGRFPALLRLFTPAGNPLTDPVELTARVNVLTGIGRVVTVGGLLVLASWWFSYFRKRHRTQRARAMNGSIERHPLTLTSIAKGDSSRDDSSRDDSVLGVADTDAAHDSE